MKRSVLRKRKRNRTRNGFLLIILLATFSIACWIYQYNIGLSEAKDGTDVHEDTHFEAFEKLEPQLNELNIVLIGNDTRDGDNGLSDTLMIAHYNQQTNDMKLASIMRDVYVEIPNHGQHKINAAFALGGPELVRRTIKHNFDIDIHNYAIVDFKGFSKVVDLIAPNGIEVDIPYEMSHGIGMTLSPGVQTLHGNELLGYVRFRNDKWSDFGRVERQQEVLSKVKDQAVTLTNLVNLPKILGVTSSYVETNVDNRTLFTIGKGMLTGKSKQVESFRIPVNDSFTNDRVSAGQVLKIDLDKNKEALQQFLFSQDEDEEHRSTEVPA